MNEKSSTQWGVPDWQDANAYPSDLPMAEWRWEFLRRSSQYRHAWEKNGRPTRQIMVNEEYGFFSYWKDPRELFDQWNRHVAPYNVGPKRTIASYPEPKALSELDIRRYMKRAREMAPRFQEVLQRDPPAARQILRKLLRDERDNFAPVSFTPIMRGGRKSYNLSG